MTDLEEKQCEYARRLFAGADFLPPLEALIRDKLTQTLTYSKKSSEYAAILKELPRLDPKTVKLDQNRVSIGARIEIDDLVHARLERTLKQLIPWRKGPFEIFGTIIDSEWVSSLKWDRIKHHIAPLSGRRIFDIGCSNGYYMFRMAAAEPELIFGIEPYTLFFMQFLAMQHFVRAEKIFCLPAKLEEITFCGPFFDTVFCMGILYHQRSPLDALNLIHSQMKTGGELVLETLILPGDDDVALFPEKRYAMMNNVYFIPTVPCLTHWLRRSGFENIRCISVAKTTQKEQRKTDWIASHSLDAFLDPEDPNLTIEGYPAPTRAVMLANAR